ncbi:hypothetical protein AAHE18_19G205200 [Arachis hypogaea]
MKYDKNNKAQYTCIFYLNTYNRGRIYRMKYYLAKISGQIKVCNKVTEDVEIVGVVVVLWATQMAPLQSNQAHSASSGINFHICTLQPRITNPIISKPKGIPEQPNIEYHTFPKTSTYLNSCHNHTHNNHNRFNFQGKLSGSKIFSILRNYPFRLPQDHQVLKFHNHIHCLRF